MSSPILESESALRALSGVLADRHPAEAVRILEAAPAEEVASFLSDEPVARATALLSRLTYESAAAVLSNLDDVALRKLLPNLEPNRAAGSLARLDEDAQERVLGLLTPSLAEELRSLLTYPPDTAGGLMDTRVTTFRPETPVSEVIRRLRAIRRRRVQDLFLVDEDGILCGSVAIQDVVLGRSDEPLRTLVRRAPAVVQATASRTEVLEVIETQRAGSVAVVDFAGRVLGVLRQEELLAATEQDVATNLVTMVGAGREERALSSPLLAVRKRLPWLQVNLLTAFLAASVVGLFEDTIATYTALAVLLPVVAGQSGNTGAQALAVTMRGLALREVRVSQWWRVGGKELIAGALNGLAVAATTAIAVYIWSHSSGLALVIFVSMIIAMTMAGFAGATIPMLLTALRQDPAQSSSIILTTVTDIVGFFSFLGIATLLAARL